MHPRTRWLGRKWLGAFIAVLATVLLAGCPSTEAPEVLASFTVTAPTTAVEETPFSLTITAVGSRGTRPYDAFTGTVTLSLDGDGGSIAPTTVALSNGEATTQATITGVTGSVTILVSGGGKSGSTTVTVTAAGPIRALPGDPSDDATAAVPELPFTADEADYTPDNPLLGTAYVSFNTLIVSFELGTTVDEANALLTSIDAEIVGGIPGIPGEVPGILVLRVPTTSHAEMNDLLDALAADERLAYVIQDSLLEESIVPGPNDGNPAGWTWELVPTGGNWGLELIRAPQLWNLNDAIERTGRTTVTAVFDTGFADAHEDLVYLQNQTPGSQGSHGTHVAGTVAATFDNGIGVDGVNPFADLVVRAITIPEHDGTLFGSRQSFGAGFLDGFRGLILSRTDIRVVNISMGYNWGPAGVNQNTNVTAQRMVMQHGGLFRTLLLILQRERTLPLIVPAAGNDSNSGFGTMLARWGSPFNYAGLVLDPPDVLGVSPIIVTESVANTGDGGATRSGFSNTGGTISAPGSSVLSTDWSTASPTSLYSTKSGTSMAAPHVTGLISYLYALDPGLSHAQMRDLLTRNAVPVAGGASNRIDAYASALDIDRVRGNTAVRLMLLDLTGDGAFSETDVAAFVAAYDAPDADLDVHGRHDLNGDGRTGGTTTARFDLNRDGLYGPVTFTIGDADVTYDQGALTDIEILCYYAYSPVFTGDVEVRDEVLEGRCAPSDATPVTLAVPVDLPDPGEGEIGADVMFNVDLSGSYWDDIATFRAQAADIVTALNASLADLRFGITSFVDAPCSSFGDAGSGDYGHRLDLALTDVFDDFQATLDGLTIRYGRDEPESQLESMYQTMTGTGYVVAQGTVCDGVADIDPSTPGWAVDRLRFLLHATDASFHRPGDIGTGGVPYPYPTDVDDVIEIAQGTGTQIFFLDAGGTTDAAKDPIASATGGAVFLLGTDSSGVVEAVRDAAQGAVRTATIRLVPSPAAAASVATIEPDAYTDIDLTTVRTLTFDVTFVTTVQPGPTDQVFTFFLSIDGAIDETNPIEVTIPAAP